jgi:CHAT domain-containing protein
MSLLGSMLLRPAKEFLLPRVVIVADGALAYLPFAALPDPSASPGGLPLVFRHEIVFLPSASSLSAFRQVDVHRRPTRIIAVVADPVFSANDPRVPKKETAEEPLKNAPSEGKTAASSFPRLLFARREADTILALVPPDQGLAVFGFNASRNYVMRGGLENFRILHFATHTMADSEHPELSAIVLSMVDQERNPQDGLVRAYEISQLDLSAELVVLSGSETALGREIRGEGLIGLARSFMYAGVPRVVASLWNVDDRSTAELMSSFYRHMLREGMTTSQALRMAQIEMARSDRWSSPYHWAAFTLQGEWR